MAFGTLLFINEKNKLYTDLINAYKHYGFNIVCACPEGMQTYVESLGIPVSRIIISNVLKSEIFDKAFEAGCNIFSTIDKKENNSHSFINHVNFEVEGDKIVRVVYEPGKPISRSYNCSSDPESWENFIFSIIQDGLVPSSFVFNNDYYLFRGSQKENTQIPSQRFGFGLTYDNKLTFKPVWNFSSSSEFSKDWSRYLDGKMEFTSSNFCDYFLVVNSPSEPIDPRKTVYFMMEPFGEVRYKDFLSTVGSSLLFKGSHKYHMNLCEWHISSIPPSESLDKKKGLSIIISDKAMDEGQKYRIELAKRLDEMSDKLNFPLEIWGKCGSLKFKNYKGEIPHKSKDIVLNRWKYHFNAENNYINNYITEKLYDSILCECFTFYKGAPNVHSYFDHESLFSLTGNVDNDINIIISFINSDAYERALPKIKLMKEKIMKLYSLPNRIKGIMQCSKIVSCIWSEKPEEQKAKVELLIDQSFTKVVSLSFPKGDPNLRWMVDVAQFGLKQQNHVMLLFDDIPMNVYQRVSECFTIAQDCELMISGQTLTEGYLVMTLGLCEKIVARAMQGLSGANLINGIKFAKI